MKSGRIAQLSALSYALAISVFLCGTITAMILYPGYDPLNNFLSALGARQSSIGKQPAEFPEIFNITVIIAGLLWIPFFPSIYPLFVDKVDSKGFWILTILMSTLVGPLLITIGIFDAGTSPDIHNFWATRLYATILISSMFWGTNIALLDNTSFYKSHKWTGDVIMSGLIVVLMAIIFFAWIPPVPPFSLFKIPFYQKLVAYTYIGYFSVVSKRIFQEAKGSSIDLIKDIAFD